ncbi:HEPN/Toprim-associated domain-containing protein [Kitasatospora sp. NPDC050543]|uniref:HEPN/Toprim-associated domain-containing protein n=1 Tax=Kitasatospora sp. NPDC050543 TaxID=3364054 RepID=UPI0037AE52E6
MAHHSYVRFGSTNALLCRDSYYPDVAALFFEDDRYHRVTADPDGGYGYGYATTIRGMAERLDLQGITPDVALRDLEAGLKSWAENYAVDPEETDPPPANSTTVERRIRFLLRTEVDSWPRELRVWSALFRSTNGIAEIVDRLHWRMDTRNLMRLLLHWSPDQDAELVLDLRELTGCCVEMDPEQPIARMARDEQLQVATRNLPLVVITEGSTDARLLSEGMKVTHPHLVGFIRFFDYGAARPPSGVDGTAAIFKGFVAAGIGNRFIILADNDAAAHGGLAKLKQGRWPSECRILHYPALPLLKAYPTHDPATGASAIQDVNGRAGSLEMYFGRDVLTDANRDLMPVRWTAVEPKTGLRQGSLNGADKRAAQQRFEAKLKALGSGRATGTEDWSGIGAIIDSIVRAFQ